MTTTHAINETAINEIAIKLNMSNQTLLAMFASPVNTSVFYNKSDIDEKLLVYNNTIKDVSLSVNVALGNLLKTLLDSYVNASISNASQKISPVIEILREDMNIRFESFKNSTVRNYQLERNITELNQSVISYAYNAAANVRHELDTKINWNFMLGFFLSIILPVIIYIATTRIYSLRMKILGSVQDLRKYAIEDLGLDPLSREETEKRKELKMKIIRTKCKPTAMKKLLGKVDINEINNEQDINDYLAIVNKEEELKDETDNKHKAKQHGKAKHK